MDFSDCACGHGDGLTGVESAAPLVDTSRMFGHMSTQCIDSENPRTISRWTYTTSVDAGAREPPWTDPVGQERGNYSI